MLRIRFHGRGGQGMKTASRIVGSAAFRQGYYAQDSPVYGAERRGAPLAAFTRFDSGPILERGVISTPDLVVIADESLLADPLIRPLAGLAPTGSVLINSSRTCEALKLEYKIDSRAVARDLTALALAHTGSTAALSVAVGVAAARLAGLDNPFIEQAVHEELQSLHLEPKRIEKNLQLSNACLGPAVIDPAHSTRIETGSAAYQRAPSQRIVAPTYDGAWRGTASVAAAPNTPLRKTGEWRVMRPSIDSERCTRCWICFVLCPDGAIALTEENAPEIDYGVCKGCLICVEECPVEAIASVRETEAR